MECQIEPSPPEDGTVPSASQSGDVPRIGLVHRIVLGLLLAAVFAEGVVYAFFRQFSQFASYDDEGRQLLVVQHMRNGHALYDQVMSAYGPFYLFQRWLIFWLFGVPLGNDTVRFATIATWCLTAIIMAAAAWRLARRTDYAAGLAAGVWLASIYYLRVLANEPGHPQELLALVVALSLWLAVELRERRMPALCAVLGAVTAALLLTKVNIGFLFGLGSGLSLLALAPRVPIGWRAARALAKLAVPIFPFVLMRSRLSEGYEPLCLIITASLLPVCLLALSGDRAGSSRIRHFLLFGAGAAATGVTLLGFGVAQGNTLAGMYHALVVHPSQVYLTVQVGVPLDLPLSATIWSLAAAAFGIAAQWWAPVRRVLWPLRFAAVGFVLSAVQAPEMYETAWAFFALPLAWLLLVPPAGRAVDEKEWFVRVLLALTACLQPLQIFPVSGSQNRVGTFVAILAGVVPLWDLGYEVNGFLARKRSPAFRRVAVSILILGPCLAIELRWPADNELSRALANIIFPLSPALIPPLKGIWLALGTGTGLFAVWGRPAARFVWILKAFVCAGILAGSLNSGLPNSASTVLIVPWIWVVLFRPVGREPGDKEWLFRLLLVILVTGQLLRLLAHTFNETLGSLSMALIAAVLLCDLRTEALPYDRPRIRAALGRLIPLLAILLPQGYAELIDMALFGILFGSLMALYRDLRNGADLKRAIVWGLSAGTALCFIVFLALPAGEFWAGLTRALNTSGEFKLVPFVSRLWPVVAIGLGLGAVCVRPAEGARFWPLRIFVCAMVWGSIVSAGALAAPWLYYTRPLTWLVLVPPPNREIGPIGWFLRLFLTLTAVPAAAGVIPFVDSELPMAACLALVTSVVLLLDLCRQVPEWIGPRGSESAARWNLMLASMTFMVGSQIVQDAASIYDGLVPVTLPGCRWTRMSKINAALFTFLTDNVEASSDSVVARLGLGSLHLWANRPPASNVIIPNVWEAVDANADERLLAAHRDRQNMMFIENSNPYQPNTQNLKFLNFIAEHFKQIARVGHYRLLVRKERSGLHLYDCAFETESEKAGKKPVLRLRLPKKLVLRGVASVEMFDEGTAMFFASTRRSNEKRLVLSDGAGRTLLPAPAGAKYPDLSGRDMGLTVEYPAGTRLDQAEFPALTFDDVAGRRLLVLPVAVNATTDVQ